MPRRRFDLSRPELGSGVAAILREAGVPEGFPPELLRAAEQARAGGERGRSELPLLTIDPPGSRDLDQAVHIERREGGFRVSYAIADVGALVAAGTPLDVEAHARGVTVYAPDAKAPLYPAPLSEGNGSLLPGEWRPAVLWSIDLDGAGEQVAVRVERSEVRSTAQHTYADLPDGFAALLAEVGGLRAAIERDRGGVSLRVPEQEVVPDGSGGWTIAYRAPLPAEDHNAQISLLTGMAAAGLMLESGLGILRIQPSPEEKAFARFRLQARALGSEWAGGQSYGEFIRSLDPAVPRQAALLQEAAGIGRGAGYATFDGGPPEQRSHFSIAADYAHATAPLRRLQDRWVSECCLAASAGAEPPGWVREGLAALPEAMREGDHRASVVERGVIDLVEALVLTGREGERFAGIVIDDRTVQLAEPAVRAPVEGACPEPGTEVEVRLSAVEAATRSVRFEVI
ncbi:MAG TPA: RNB domain-containing ribonuclease [Solirubrobacterales bacterium]|nr:RNB domain-containing ribonuclease [Solirubrobacterales bacterium]